MTKWNKYIDLRYRVFLRKAEDSNALIEEVRALLKSTWMLRNLEFGEVINLNTKWPVPPEKEEELAVKYLLVDNLGIKHLIIRELPVIIHLNSEFMARSKEEVIETLDSVCGENVFAVMRVVEERLTEFQAI